MVEVGGSDVCCYFMFHFIIFVCFPILYDETPPLFFSLFFFLSFYFSEASFFLQRILFLHLSSQCLMII